MTNATTTKPAGIAQGLPDIGAYVACLASYNNGYLHGAWVDLQEASTVEEVQECIDWVIATSPTPGAEEYAVHDWAGVPGSISSQEWPNWEEALTLIDAIDEHGEAFQLWHENAIGYNLDPSDFERDYVGLYDSGEDFAREYFEERHGAALEQLKEVTFAIDWETVWERGEMSQYFWGSKGEDGFHVFRGY